MNIDITDIIWKIVEQKKRNNEELEGWLKELRELNKKGGDNES